VHLNKIQKISTKKIWVQGVVGGVLLAGAVASFASYVDNFSYCPSGCYSGIDENDGGGAFFLGLGLTGAAIAVASAGYKKIGTSNWFVTISNKPDTVNN